MVKFCFAASTKYLKVSLQGQLHVLW